MRFDINQESDAKLQAAGLHQIVKGEIFPFDSKMCLPTRVIKQCRKHSSVWKHSAIARRGVCTKISCQISRQSSPGFFGILSWEFRAWLSFSWVELTGSSCSVPPVVCEQVLHGRTPGQIKVGEVDRVWGRGRVVMIHGDVIVRANIEMEV